MKYFSLAIFICIMAISVFFTSCVNNQKPYTIAIDKEWYSLNLNGQEATLNVFLNELLLQISKEKKVEFKLINANWDSIFENLDKGKYQGVFSPIEPYNFNRAKYDFSDPILKTGFSLIVAKNSKYKSLEDMQKKRIAYIKGDHALLVLQKYPNILDQSYLNIPLALGAIVEDRVDGAVINIILAHRYVEDLLYNDLKLLYPPLTDQSIRLITLKDKNRELIKVFNGGLKQLQKSNKFQELKNKWQLP